MRSDRPIMNDLHTEKLRGLRARAHVRWDNGHWGNSSDNGTCRSLTRGALGQRSTGCATCLWLRLKPKHNGMHHYRFLCISEKPMKWFTKSGSFAMIEIIKSERISRRKALRLLGLTVAFGVATSVGVMTSASCTLVRYYVATYSAPVAEAWARSKGATEADIRTARRCITPQRTAQVG
jgi:hypothetical protein